MKLLFAWRYFRAKKSTNAINIIAWVSMTAIVVGAAALILVLSVFNGFEDLVKSLYSSFYPDMKISPSSGKTLTLTAAQLKQLKGFGGIRDVSLVAEDKGILENGDVRVPAFLKGVDSNYTKVSGVGDRVEKGKFEVGDGEHPMVILGSGIEYALGVEADRALQPLGVYLFRRGSPVEYTADPTSSLSHESMVTTGVFRIQQDFDDHYVIISLDFVRRMTGLKPDEYTSAELAITDATQADVVRQRIAG